MRETFVTIKRVLRGEDGDRYFVGVARDFTKEPFLLTLQAVEVQGCPT